MSPRGPPRYVLYAAAAVLIWSSLAVISINLESVPSFMLLGVSLTIGGLLSALRMREWYVPLGTFLTGLVGIFGYHSLIFEAFKKAPVVEVSLLNYLWPVLIVFLSPVVLPSYRLRRNHVAGVLMGLAGASLIISGGTVRPDPQYLPGYLMAAGAALVWALYSLMLKRLPSFSTWAVGGFCLASGALSMVVYLIGGGAVVYEPSLVEWGSMFLLGVGPMGAAFFLWDRALKEGDPRIVGSLSYLTPLLSTLLLMFVGGERLTVVSLVAMVLLISGSVVGSLELLRVSP